MADREIKLAGKLLIRCEIEAITGLHIGGSGGAFEIGGMDNPVIRNPLTNQPYIPGSSLRGKMRALLDRYYGNELNKNIGSQVKIHECKREDDYGECAVCKIFGLPGECNFAEPARLLVRDAFLTKESAESLGKATDMVFTEVKTEVAIDRITSAANPRQNERVPAGAVFAPVEMVFSFFEIDGQKDGATWLESLLIGMEQVEDDYLGGGGSRGSGKIAFRNVQLILKTRDYYEAKTPEALEMEFPDLYELRDKWEEVSKRIAAAIGGGDS